MKCCSPARAKAKKAAVRKATKKANRQALKGIKPKKAHAKKTSAKKTKAKKPAPCRICGGKGNANKAALAKLKSAGR